MIEAQNRIGHRIHGEGTEPSKLESQGNQDCVNFMPPLWSQCPKKCIVIIM